jgi:hypothetical protein
MSSGSRRNSSNPNVPSGREKISTHRSTLGVDGLARTVHDGSRRADISLTIRPDSLPAHEAWGNPTDTADPAQWHDWQAAVGHVFAVTDGAPKTGTIMMEWTAGADPDDVASYAWSVQCEPSLPDELVASLLAEVVKGVLVPRQPTFAMSLTHSGTPCCAATHDPGDAVSRVAVQTAVLTARAYGPDGVNLSGHWRSRSRASVASCVR